MHRIKSTFRSTFNAVIMSLILLGLVGFASNETLGLFEVSLAAYVALVACFYALFGKASVFFNIVFGNVMAIYLCFFNFFVDSLFLNIEQEVLIIGFLLPLVSFLSGAMLKRTQIKKIIVERQEVHESDFARAFMWLAPIAAVGIFAFSFHSRVPGLDAFFLAEMAVISFFVLLGSRDITLMLMDTGTLFSDFFASNIKLVKPAFAFFTFYSLAIILFAAIYSIVEHFSLGANFTVRGELRDLSFVESLYFSMVTFSTLGFGDIVPLNNGIRFIVGIQAFVGALLFLFGVHAILNHKKSP